MTESVQKILGIKLRGKNGGRQDVIRAKKQIGFIEPGGGGIYRAVALKPNYKTGSLDRETIAEGVIKGDALTALVGHVTHE